MRTPEDTVTRELRAVEEALAAGEPGASDPVERELQELALALRADTPEPDPAFGTALGERVRAGFPPEPGSRRARVRDALAGARRLRLPRLRRPPMPALAGVAALVVGLAVAVSLEGEEERNATSPAVGDGAGESLQTTPVQPRSVAPGDGGFVPGRERRIERSASLTLAAPADELDRVANEVTAVTDRHRGFVLRSSVSSGDEGAEGGSFDLRIPAARLQPALRDLSGLADVRSRSQTGQDITREYVSARDRLDAARAERRGLLRRLARADSDAEAEAIRQRLDIVAGQIRGLRGQLRDLRLRTDYVAVSVTLVDKEGNRDFGPAGGGTEDALDDAVGSLEGALNLTVRALGVAIPLGILAGLTWLGGRLAIRRRRESALA